MRALAEERSPGNVRELCNVIERTLALAGELPVLRARDFGSPVPERMTR